MNKNQILRIMTLILLDIILLFAIIVATRHEAENRIDSLEQRIKKLESLPPVTVKGIRYDPVDARTLPKLENMGIAE